MKKNIWKTKTSYTFLIYSEKLYNEKNPYLLQLVIIFSYSSVYKQIKMTLQHVFTISILSIKFHLSNEDWQLKVTVNTSRINFGQVQLLRLPLSPENAMRSCSGTARLWSQNKHFSFPKKRVHYLHTQGLFIR